MIHGVPAGEGKATLCCGVFPSLLPDGEPVTEHSGIVNCDGRALCCPGCGVEAEYADVRVEQANEFSSIEWLTIMKMIPCGHKFLVFVGKSLKIELEKFDE